MDYLLLRSFDNYINAGITLARLDEEGITGYLKDEYTVTIDPLLSNAVGGIKLMVHPGDLDEATELLAQWEKDYRRSFTCSKCGSDDVENISKPLLQNRRKTILSWFFASYKASALQVYHCYGCGFETEELGEETVRISEKRHP